MTTTYNTIPAAKGKLWAIESIHNNGQNWVDEDSTRGSVWSQVEEGPRYPELETGKILVEIGGQGRVVARYVVDSEAEIPALVAEFDSVQD